MLSKFGFLSILIFYKNKLSGVWVTKNITYGGPIFVSLTEEVANLFQQKKWPTRL